MSSAQCRGVQGRACTCQNPPFWRKMYQNNPPAKMYKKGAQKCSWNVPGDSAFRGFLVHLGGFLVDSGEFLVQVFHIFGGGGVDGTIRVPLNG